MSSHPSTPIDSRARLLGLPILFDTLTIETLPAVTQLKIAQIDACLPQTQCGLCEHPDGCLPYATAIVMDYEPYNKCVPGGQPVTDAIAQIMMFILKNHSPPSLQSGR